MKAIYFPEVNVEIAKNQPEYNTLPAYISNEGVMVTCFEFTDEEIQNIIKNKKIWVQVLMGNNRLQPFSLIPVKNYFESVITNGTDYIVSNEDVVDDAIDNLLNNDEE